MNSASPSRLPLLGLQLIVRLSSLAYLDPVGTGRNTRSVGPCGKRSARRVPDEHQVVHSSAKSSDGGSDAPLEVDNLKPERAD
jgi:hypothetical protein